MCSRKHHQSLCESRTTQNAEVDINTTQGIKSRTTTAVSKNKVNILLQTACTFAYSVDDNLVPVRVLMDTGSQCSYLYHKRFRNKIGFETLEMRETYIKYVW